MAVLAALAGSITGYEIGKQYGKLRGLCCALLLISLPAFQEYSHDIMTEMLMCVLVLLATLSYARYLKNGGLQSALWFASLSTAAILTNGAGIHLAFVPPFAVAISRRWELLKRFSFWLPALIVLTIAGPWYFWAPGAQHEAVAPYGDLMFDYPRFTESLAVWGSFLGVLPSMAAVVGLVIAISKITRRTIDERSAAILAALAGAYMSRILIGAFEARHLIATVALLLMLAVAGWDWFQKKCLISIPAGLPRTLLVGTAFVAVVAFNAFQAPLKRHYGFIEVARDLLSRPELKNSVFLICSNAVGEGMFISEVAMHESRPGHMILRGTKMLASMRLLGSNYHMRFNDPEGALRYLESIPAGIVVIDAYGRDFPHGKQLYSALSAHPDQWEQMNLSGGTAEDPISTFRLIGHEGRSVGKVRVQTLYGDLEN
jgi:hypothetical protein